jgi:hypothetical protein
VAIAGPNSSASRPTRAITITAPAMTTTASPVGHRSSGRDRADTSIWVMATIVHA